MTRRISAGEVTPARHLATPSSTIVVIPACIAALSIDTESVCTLIRCRTSSVTWRTSNTPNSAAITGAPASLAFAGLENGFANLQSDRAIARVGGKIGVVTAFFVSCIDRTADAPGAGR